MHVLQVMASGERGGGADHLVGLVGALRDMGVCCSAVVGFGPLAERLARIGVGVRHVDLMGWRADPRALAHLWRAIRGMADVVHLHGTRAAFYGVLASIGQPSVYTAHGLAYRQSSGRIRHVVNLAAEAVACRATRVISVSLADLVDLERRHLLGPQKGTHIPNAVDSERFSPGDRHQARLRLGLSDDAFIVGTVSRLVAQKAVGDLIDAIGACDGIHLLIVGDGPLREQLKARARPCGRVTFLGGRDDVPDILPALDVFVLSSHWEGEPIALLEAMAAQIACVATATDGSSEILKGSKGGVLVPIGQPHELARALEQLRVRPEWRQQVAARGRALACERDWRMAAQRTYAVYRSAMTDFSRQTC